MFALGADQQRKAAAVPPAKRAKVEPQAPPAALRAGGAQMQAQAQQRAAMMAMAGGARPPLPPGSMQMSGMMMGMQPQMTPAQVAAAATARLQASMAQKRAQFTPIVRPTGEEEKQFVPKPRLQVGGVGVYGWFEAVSLLAGRRQMQSPHTQEQPGSLIHRLTLMRRAPPHLPTCRRW
jgi:hypothetical protein